MGRQWENRRKDTSVEPLSEDTLAKVEEYVTTNGGQVLGGRLTTDIPGVKKAQLRGHFTVKQVAGADFVVMTIGHTYDPTMTQTRKASGEDIDEINALKKQRRDQGLDDPPPPLDDEVIQQVTEILNEHDGQLLLGKLVSKIPGLKKAQLEEHFSVHRNEVLKDFIVTHSGAKVNTKGLKPTPKAENKGHGKGNGKGNGKGFNKGSSQKGNGKGNFAMPAMPWGPAGKGMGKQQQAMMMQMMEYFTGYGVGGGGNRVQGVKKNLKGDKKPSQAPVVVKELTKAKIGEIRIFVGDSGGSVSGGVLTTKFPGIKKAQCEQHFTVSRGPSDWMVGL